MSWAFLATSSYFLSAFAAAIDKILLKHRIPNPLSYAFYTGISSVGVLILLPFGFSFIAPMAMVFAMLAGTAFLVALFFLYAALRANDSSRVVPLIGAMTPLFVLLLSYIFFGAESPKSELLAIFFFIVGGLLLSLEKEKKLRPSVNLFLLLVTCCAALAMGFTFVLSKALFNRADFMPAFIWMRMGSFFAALGLLTVPLFRNSIFTSSRTMDVASGGYLLINKILGAVAFLILNYAIALGPESLISAMRGFEYLFVFILALLLSHWWPRLLKESFDRNVLLYKLVGIICIGLGSYNLFYL